MDWNYLGEVLRIIAYAVLVPTSIWVSLDRWNLKQRMLAGLFFLQGVSYLFLLATVAFGTVTPLAYLVRSFLLTPVIVVLAVVMSAMGYEAYRRWRMADVKLELNGSH